MIFDFSNFIIAHRGASAYAPENTMSAFVKAAQLGAKWVEFDVVLAKCGTPIIFHDELLDRTTNAQGLVDTLTYAELRTLDAGKWFHPCFSGERVPTLHDVLVFLHSMGMSANVEIKPIPGKEELTVKKMLEVIADSPFRKSPSVGKTPLMGKSPPAPLFQRGERTEIPPFEKEGIKDAVPPFERGGIRDAVPPFEKGGLGGIYRSPPQLLFSSFSISSLEYLRYYAPQAPIGLLLEQWEPNWEVACDTLNCVSINVDEIIVTPKTAQKVKEKNKYLLCYTVNDPARAQKLFEMGVDAVFCDYPDMIERELAYGS